jgi:hypothetical protein
MGFDQLDIVKLIGAKGARLPRKASSLEQKSTTPNPLLKATKFTKTAFHLNGSFHYPSKTKQYFSNILKLVIKLVIGKSIL